MDELREKTWVDVNDGVATANLRGRFAGSARAFTRERIVFSSRGNASRRSGPRGAWLRRRGVTVLDILDGRVRFTRGDFATVFPL